MIRDATNADIDKLVPLAEKFHAEARLDQIVPFDAGSFARSVGALIAAEDGIVCVIEEDGIVGWIGGLVFQCHFNFAYRQAQELYWYVSPESRGRGLALLRAFEEAARKRGAVTSSMITLANNNPVAIARVYKRRGYVPLEYSFIKRL